MFTGIVSAIGTITQTQSTGGDLRIRIACPWGDLALGESVACNGACLTVVDTKDGWFDAELSGETISCTAPGQWNKDAKVNLERALQLGDRLSGHMVTGHVDGLATLKSADESGGSHVLTLEVAGELSRLIAAKGSVTLDGVSLTVNIVKGNEFSVNVIPHTWQHTTLGTKKTGDKINVEIDLIARYVQRLLQPA